MKIAPISVAAKVNGWKMPSWPASAVPTGTGATAAGRVRGRAAMSQIRAPLGIRRLRAAGKLREVRAALLDVGVATLVRLLAAVEEEVRVVGELLEPGEAVLGRVEARLQQAQRERREREHLTAPGDGLVLEALERHDRVDQSPVQRRLGVVLAAEEPHLAGPLGADLARQQPGAVAAVEGADPGPGLAEAGVVGGDRQVADDVQHVPPSDRVAGDHRHDRLRGAAELQGARRG